MDTKRPASFDDSYLRRHRHKTTRKRMEICIRRALDLNETTRKRTEICMRRYLHLIEIRPYLEFLERRRSDADLWIGELIYRGLVSPDAREKMREGEGAPEWPSNPSSFNTGRIRPDHLHIDQVHAQDSEIASSSGSVEPQIASDCLTLSSTMSQPSSAPHFSLQKMSDEADVRIEILEVDNHTHLMQDVGSHTNIASARPSSGNYVSAHDLQPSSSAMAQEKALSPHFNQCGTSNEADVRIIIDDQDDNHRLSVECLQSCVASSGVTSSSGVCASVHDRLLQSSNGADARAEIRDHGNDNTSVHGRRLQLNEPESSNGADARSEIRDHGNDNAAQRMRTDFQSDTRDPGADARSEISDHVGEMTDHGGDDPIEIRLEVSDHGDDDDPIETRPEESDHVIVAQVGGQADVGGQLNAIVAQVGGQAVVNLMASHSPDSPFLRLFAVFAGCSFVGGLYANSRLKNQKVAEYLTKFSAICLLFAVNIALGVNVLEGTKWHLNIVVTVALCILSVAVVARADIGLLTTPASNQSRTSRQTTEASSSSPAPNFEAPVGRPHTTGSC